MAYRCFLDPQATRRVPLRVEVDEKNLLPHLSKGCREIDCGRRLPDAAFLVDDSENLSLTDNVLDGGFLRVGFYRTDLGLIGDLGGSLSDMNLYRFNINGRTGRISSLVILLIGRLTKRSIAYLISMRLAFISL